MAKIRETDVKDSRGEIVISPGLKVRHKSSQYEYTVDGVIQDDNGEIQVILRMPDSPRFEPNVDSSDVIQSKAYSKHDLIYEVDPTSVYYEPEDEEPEDPTQDLMSVSQEEFEKEYEVK